MIKKVLKWTAFATLAAIGVTALVRSNLMPGIKEKFKEYDKEFEKNKSIKRRLQIVAEVMKKKIKETECRTSNENHEKRQQEYDRMDWSEKKTPRCEMM